MQKYIDMAIIGRLFQKGKTDLKEEEMRTEHFPSQVEQLLSHQGCKSAKWAPGKYFQVTRSFSVHPILQTCQETHSLLCKILEVSGWILSFSITFTTARDGRNTFQHSKQTNKMCYSYVAGSFWLHQVGTNTEGNVCLKTENKTLFWILLVTRLPTDYYVESSFMSTI